MKNLISLLIKMIIIIVSVGSSLAQESNKDKIFPVLKGPYFGQKLPGKTPEVFAEDILSYFKNSSIGLSFTKGGKELFYSSWGGPAGVIVKMTKLLNNKWTEPVPAPFSGKNRDWDQNLSPDGSTLVFSSMRSGKGDGKNKKDSDIWFAKRKSSGVWGEAEPLDTIINTGLHQVHPTISSKGTLYFFLQDTVRGLKPDIYMSEYVNGRYNKPVRLGNTVNTEKNPEADPFIAPDESYIIFNSTRPDGLGRGDIYISFRNKDNSWSQAVSMGPDINSETHDYCGRVSPDGKYFFFSRRNSEKKYSDFYWVDAGFIEELRKKNVK